MSDTSQGPGWWRASDGRWYPPTDGAPGPGWWLASDGQWYPPEEHPDYRRPDERAVAPDEPTEALPFAPTEGVPSTEVVPSTEGVPRTEVVVATSVGEPTRPPRPPLATDLRRLWQERRGLRIAGIAIAVLGVLALLGALFGDRNDKPEKVVAGSTTSVPPAAFVATTGAPTTTEATTTTTTTTTTSTTSTTIAPPTTRAPATTAATSPPTSTPIRQGVTPGAFCTPQGAQGVTNTGMPMVCTTTASDSRARWRMA